MLHPFLNTDKCVEKTRGAINFEVFGNEMKDSFDSDIAFQSFRILGDIRSKISSNFMIIKTTFSTSFMVVISFVFLHELLMSLRT